MSKRKYTRVKTVEGLIVTMRAEGLTLREIGDELGLSYKKCEIGHTGIIANSGI